MEDNLKMDWSDMQPCIKLGDIIGQKQNIELKLLISLWRVTAEDIPTVQSILVHLQTSLDGLWQLNLWQNLIHKVGAGPKGFMDRNQFYFFKFCVILSSNDNGLVPMEQFCLEVWEIF